MNNEAIESFVKYGVNLTMTKSKFILFGLLINLFSLLIISAGISSDITCAVSIIYSVFLIAVIIFTFAVILKFPEQLNVKQVIQGFTIISLNVIIMFYGIELVFLLSKTITLSHIWLLIPLGVGILSFLVYYIKSKLGVYIKKESGEKYRRLVISLIISGCGLGGFLSTTGKFDKIFEKIASLGNVENIVAIIILFVPSVFIFILVQNLLKLYYIKRYKMNF